MSSPLFAPLTLRGITFRNRILLSPMCQYSSVEGLPQPWHFQHLVSRAVGGFGAVIQEATAVSPEGRISPQDAGLWNDAQAAAYQPITAAIRAAGAVPGVQLAHAGRKASTAQPWVSDEAVGAADGGWRNLLAPSALPFRPADPTPQAMTLAQIETLKTQFVAAAQRARKAGFELIELHAAHGYLLHEFLSPLSNQRQDAYGGSLENRMRLVLETAQAVRAAWPAHLPMFVRLSATDWVAGGWDVPQSVTLCQQLKALGVDLIDVSSGGLMPEAKIVTGPGYQVPFAAAIRQAAGLPVGAVGMITEAQQAEAILASGQADCVLLARAALRDPYWPIHAAQALGEKLDYQPVQYGRM